VKQHPTAESRHHNRGCHSVLSILVAGLVPRSGFRELFSLGAPRPPGNWQKLQAIQQLSERLGSEHRVREGKPLVARSAANQEWALDFRHEALEWGRAIRC
jgi:hypothetical protein